MPDLNDYDTLKSLVLGALEDLKAENIVVLDVRALTSMTDMMVVASGRADRHVKSVAENVVFEAKQAGLQPIGVEGMERGEWVLIDLGGAIVHVMHPQSRDYYQIEKLWEVSADPEDASPG